MERYKFIENTFRLSAAALAFYAAAGCGKKDVTSEAVLAAAQSTPSPIYTPDIREPEGNPTPVATYTPTPLPVQSEVSNNWVELVSITNGGRIARVNAVITQHGWIIISDSDTSEILGKGYVEPGELYEGYVHLQDGVVIEDVDEIEVSFHLDRGLPEDFSPFVDRQNYP